MHANMRLFPSSSSGADYFQVRVQTIQDGGPFGASRFHSQYERGSRLSNAFKTHDEKDGRRFLDGALKAEPRCQWNGSDLRQRKIGQVHNDPAEAAALKQ